MLCRGCGLVIADRYLQKIGDTYWHENCVKCSICSCELNEKCYLKFGALQCAEDYFRQYSIHRCFVCGSGIAPHHLVFKLKPDIICHSECQRCVVCGMELGVGSRAFVDQRTRRLLCQYHVNLVVAEQRDAALLKKHHQKINPTRIIEKIDIRSPETPTPNSEIEMKPVLTPAISAPSSGQFSSDLGGPSGGNHRQIVGGGGSRYVRRRGPRTTIRPSQLDTLNRIFGSTPKPSKQARARLALETGLSMRVIQVWFQNRRSKERRLKHLCNWIRQNEGRALSSASGIDPSVMTLAPLLGEDDDDGLLMIESNDEDIDDDDEDDDQDDDDQRGHSLDDAKNDDDRNNM